MELALAIQSSKQLNQVIDPWKNEHYTEVEQETLKNLEETLAGFSVSNHFSRLYFGSEFCQYRLPKLRDIQKAYEASLDAGLLFTFVTPYVPQQGLTQLEEILKYLDQKAEQNNEKVEVVVNDWGVLYAIKHSYSQLIPIIGRLLNKMIRDPRVTHLYSAEDAPRKAQAVVSNTAMEVSYFQKFLLDHQVERIEFDNTIQKMEADGGMGDFSSSLHLGYGCIATGRSCLVGTLHKPKQEKFKGDVVCKQQCQHYQAELVSKKGNLGVLPTRNFQKGNSVFYQQTKEMLEQGVKWAVSKNIDRFVISPKIPV